MLDLRYVAIRYRLGLLDTESLVRVADTLLEEGLDTPTVVKLVTLEPAIMADAGPLFERICKERSVEIPDTEKAVSELLRYYLDSIASGTRTPRDGLQNIMDEVYFPHIVREPVQKYVGDSRGLEHLIGAYWGYDDLKARPEEVSFQGKYGAEAIARWEEYVRQLVRNWLAR
jgi:hypothetical protein